jgi:hypothetical protein
MSVLSYQRNNEATRNLLRDKFRAFHLQTLRSEPSSSTMIDAAEMISSRALRRPQEELSALPIWAFTLGIFALLTFGLTAVPSIICGHLALARSRSSEPGSLAKSVALAGLVIGYASAALLGTWIVVLSRNLSQ